MRRRGAQKRRRRRCLRCALRFVTNFLFAGRAEAALAALRLRKLLRGDKACGNEGQNYKLGYTLAVFYLLRGIRIVMQRNYIFPAVIAVAHSHAVCGTQTLLCRHAAAGKNRAEAALRQLKGQPDVKHTLSLRPALRLESRLTQVKQVPAGQSIGYSRSFIAPRDMRIGVVPIGYGDGYRRANSNRGYCIICGQKAPICGKVCMDQMMVDITDIPQASSGELVTLIGAQGETHIWADEMADICSTISYEILLGISKRVPKVYCGR